MKDKVLGILTFLMILTVKIYIFYETIRCYGEVNLLTFALTGLLLIFFYVGVYKLTKNMVLIMGLNILINGTMIGTILYHKYIVNPIVRESFYQGMEVLSNGAKDLGLIGSFYLLLDVLLFGILLRHLHQYFGQQKRNQVLGMSFLMCDLLILLMMGFTGNEQQSINVMKQVFRENQMKEIHLRHSKWYGSSKDQNIIMIQLPSIQGFCVEERKNEKTAMPYTASLMKKGLTFDHFYQQVVDLNTWDAEFVAMNSLYPVEDAKAMSYYKNNYFYGMPWVLREKGYKTVLIDEDQYSLWREDEAYSGQGFMFMGNTLGKETSGQVKKFMATGQPVYMQYIMDVPSMAETMMFKKEDEEPDSLIGNYLVYSQQVDQQLRELMANLKNLGLYQETLFVIYGDHQGITLEDIEMKKEIENYTGHPFEVDELYRVPLIIYDPKMEESNTIEVVGSTVDLMPTVLDLLGVANTSPITLGSNLLIAERGVALIHEQGKEGSYISDDITYLVGDEGTFSEGEGFDTVAHKIIPLNSCKLLYKETMEELARGRLILKENLLKQVAIIEEEKKDLPTTIIGITPSALKERAVDGDNYFYLKLPTDEKEQQTVRELLAKNSDLHVLLEGEDQRIQAYDQFIRGYEEIASQIIPVINEAKHYNALMYFGYQQVAFSGPDNTVDQFLEACHLKSFFGVFLTTEQIEKGMGQALNEQGISVYTRSLGDQSKTSFFLVP